jgi:multidrug efflux system membrane fusion protein
MNDVSKHSENNTVKPGETPPLLTYDGPNTPSTPHGSRLKALAIVFVCLFAIGGLAWYLSHRNAKAGPAGASNRARPSATVAFAVVKKGDVPLRLQALGTVVPIAVATVRPQVSGVLSQIFYHEGQTVKRGDKLVEIDPRPFRLAMQQARGQMLKDQADLANAKAILERDQVLLSQDSIAQQEVDTQEAAVAQLQAAVEADRAAVGTAQLNLSYSTVTAPIDGRVGLRPVDIGNYVSTSDTTGVATITQLAPIDVTFALPSDAVTPIQQRVSAGATMPTIVLDRTRTVTLEEGTFLTLDNQIDTQTGTIRAKARFANDKNVLFPNQFVNVQVQLDTVKNAMVIPAAAIRHGPKGEFVYRIAQDRTAHVQLIKTGPATDELTSVMSGLNVGDHVVTEGGDRLTDGSTVRLPGQGGGGRRVAGQGADSAPGAAGAGGWRQKRAGTDGAAQAAGGTGAWRRAHDEQSGAGRDVSGGQGAGARASASGAAQEASASGEHKRRRPQNAAPADAG